MRNETSRETQRDTIREVAAVKGYKLIDAFAGPGGMSAGLHHAGFSPVFAFDIDPVAAKTYNHSVAACCIVADAEKLAVKEVLDHAGCEIGELALFAGGPPCQGFSKQKRGAHLGDDRNALILEFVRFVDGLKPRAFFFENVKIFGQKRGRQYTEVMFDRLSGEYMLSSGFYNAAEYGLAQTRERFIVVGIRNDVPLSFERPVPTTVVPLTVGQIIGDLPEPPFDYSEHPLYPNHQRARVTEANIKRFSYVPQGGGWQDIPMAHRLECHKNVDTKSGGWPDVYGRLEWDGQCPTITGGFDSFTRGRYGHPLQDRPLTPREAARLQGFDDAFVFHGTRADIRSQIGNAVPPPLSKAVGLEIARCLLQADGMGKDQELQKAIL